MYESCKESKYSYEEKNISFLILYLYKIMDGH